MNNPYRQDRIKLELHYTCFHDEPLQGNRRGQRSIRLNQAYRAIYLETSDGDLELVEIIEVTKHEY